MRAQFIHTIRPLRRWFICLVLVGGIVGPATAVHAKKKSDDSKLQGGIEAFEEDNWKTVLKKLKPFLNQDNPIPDYVLYMVGVAERHEGDCSEAADHFAKLRRNYTRSVFATDSILEEARALVCAKDFELGRTRAQEFLKTKPYKRLAAETQLLLARSYLESGAKETARAKLRDFWVDASDDDLAQDALKLLKKAGGKISGNDKWRRARHLYKMREWVQAKNILVELGAQDSFLFAECIFRLRDYQRAKKLFESLLARRESTGKAQARLATINARIGDYNSAIKHNLSIAKKYAGSKKQRSALKKVAFLHRDRQEFEKSAKVLQELLQKPLRKREKIEALEDYAWVSYRAGNLDVAINTIDDLLEMKLNKEQAAKMLFWKGKILSKQVADTKDKQERKDLRKLARETFREAWKHDKWGYYGLSALRDMNDKDKEKKFYSTLKIEDQRRARRIRQVAVDAAPSMNGLFHLPRAQALHSMGRKRLATREMKAAFREAKGRPALMKLVGEMAYEVGNYHVPMIVALRKPGLMDRPEDAWNWIYPAAYQPIVERHAGRRHLEPNLVYSMMRQESAFQEQVVSSAGARGLIQIMPFTGRRLARIMGWKGFKTIDLFEPEINIALSTLYVRMNSDLFDGHLPAVIASYNAGEHAVARWLPSRQHLDYWEFIEEIPYRETNKYTKRVMRNYWMYNYIYSAGKPAKSARQDT